MPKATWGSIEGSPWEEDLDDFPVYDGDLPPKGVYRCAMKFLRLKKNSNGDPMLNGLLIINEPAGSKKAQYNGKDFWFNLNVTNQGSRWVNNFLSALFPEAKVAAIRKAFWDQKVMIDKGEPPNVLSIGGVKITENMLISAQCKHKTYQGDVDLDPTRFMRPSDLVLNTEGVQETSDGDEDEWEEDETPEVDSDSEEPGDDEDELTEEEAARLDELEAMDRPALLKAAKAVGVSVKRGTPEEEIVNAIFDAEFPVDGDEDEDEEEEDEEVAEEEPEEEPEPEKPVRRRRPGSAASKPAAKEEPAPARTKTGTRRRRATGEPPF